MAVEMERGDWPFACDMSVECTVPGDQFIAGGKKRGKNTRRL